MLFSCLTIFILSFAFRDADYFWHIKVGEYMVNHGLLNHDVFSWSVYGKYWMSHEWLFEIILYGFKCIFGNIHILVYAFVCILSLFLIIFFSNKKEFLKNPLFGIVWCFLGIILIYFVQGRPQLLSFILLCLSIWFCIDLYRNKDSKKIKNFLEKSEIKEKWFKFAKNDINENFVDFNPIQTFHLISELLYNDE